MKSIINFHIQLSFLTGIMWIFMCTPAFAQEFPFTDLPEDLNTQKLKNLYSESKILGNPKLDSLWNDLMPSRDSLEVNQAAILNVLRGKYLANSELYEQAANAYAESLEAAEGNGWTGILYMNKMGLATIEYYLDNRDIALQKWVSIADSIPERFWYTKATLLGNIAAVYFEKWVTEPKSNIELRATWEQIMLDNFNTSISILNAQNDQISLCRIYGVFAMYYRAKGLFAESARMLSEATNTAMRYGLNHQRHFTLINWAKYYNTTEEYWSALDSINKAIAYFDEHGPKNQLYHAKSIKTISLTGLEKFKESSALHREMINLKRDMDIERMSRQVHLYKTELEVSQKENEIRKRESELRDQKLENDAIQQRSQLWMLLAVGVVIAVLFVALLWAQSVKNKAKRARQEQKLAEQKNAFRKVIEGQEQERTRIAQELHDGIGQQLSGVKMALENMRPDGTGEENLNQIIQIVSASSEEVRTLAHQMAPNVLYKKGLVAAIEDMINQMHQLTGIQFTFDSTISDKTNIEPHTSLTIYRCIQELINNSIKHAEAKTIDLQIYVSKLHLIGAYSDDGKGFDINETKAGLGLSGITSRIENENGSIQFQSNKKEGFNCTFRIPVS